MFSGIVESKARVKDWSAFKDIFKLVVERPSFFDDIKNGDSICVNGVCLTVDFFDADTISFAVGNETLRVTGWQKILFENGFVNLERSLRLGDRIHGHLVTGHVDGLARVKKIVDLEACREIDVELLTPQKFVWTKGSIGLDGVSLTVNSFENNIVKVCLIPETLKRTTLSNVKVNDVINVEYDYFAKAQLAFTEGNKNALHT